MTRSLIGWRSPLDLRIPAAPPLAPSQHALLSLAGGARGWTSAGVSLVIRPAATDRERIEAAEILLAGTGHHVARDAA